MRYIKFGYYVKGVKQKKITSLQIKSRRSTDNELYFFYDVRFEKRNAFMHFTNNTGLITRSATLGQTKIRGHVLRDYRTKTITAGHTVRNLRTQMPKKTVRISVLKTRKTALPHISRRLNYEIKRHGAHLIFDISNINRPFNGCKAKKKRKRHKRRFF